MKPQIHIGCSACNNPNWKGIFYPPELPRSRWFDFYARHLNTYEINSTFYKTPKVKSLHAWHQKTPPGFLFSVKVPRNVTHYRRLVDCRSELDGFYGLCRDALAEKLACILFQMPPSFSFTPERLALIVQNVNPDFDNVFEFRHASWWQPEVYQMLQAHDITFCNVSYPNLPETVIATNDIGYIRLHGAPKLFYSGYSEVQLEYWLSGIRAQSNWRKVFVYFNNTADVYGIENAMQAKEIML